MQNMYVSIITISYTVDTVFQNEKCSGIVQSPLLLSIICYYVRKTKRNGVLRSPLIFQNSSDHGLV